MARSAKNTGAEHKYLAEQDEKVAMQIKEALFFFHSEVLHGLIALTMPKSLLLIILLLLGRSSCWQIAGFLLGNSQMSK